MAEVPTARGDSIDTSELGCTLGEHVFIVSPELERNWPDLTFGGPKNEDQRIARAVSDLKVAKEHGLDTLIDKSLPGSGRYVPWLRRVAEASRVNIIVSTGYYTWHEANPYFTFRERFASLIDEPQVSLADLLVRDIEVGIADTGVRAGLIKFATDRYGLTEGVMWALTAAAQAHRRTGVPITTHNTMGAAAKSAAVQQEELGKLGVDLRRVLLGHIDATPADEPIEVFETLMRKGSSLSFDTIGLTGSQGPGAREVRIDRLVELCKRGYAGQIMLGHNDSSYDDLLPVSTREKVRKFRAWTAIARDLLPALSERGVTDEQIRQMTVDNPRRFFETRDLGPY